MYVAPGYRGKPIGNLLLTHILAKARRLGFSQIILETVHSMETAIKLYEKAGFVRINEHAVSPRCDILMKLELQKE